jgi:hypothetical protein
MKATPIHSGISLVSLFSRRRLKRILILAAYAMATMLPARANNLVVTSAADSGANTLRAQVAAANPGDVITFDSTLSGATITLASGQILISNNLAVDASDLAAPINISGTSTSRIFQVVSPATLALYSVVLEHGTATNNPGGAVRVDGSLVASNCTFQFNNARGGAGEIPENNGWGGAGGGGAGMGGAIFSDGTSLTLIECQFLNNSAHGGNGGDNNSGNGLSGYPGAGGGPNGAPAGGASGNRGGFGGGGSGGALVGGYPYQGGAGGFGGGGGGAAALFQLGYGYTNSPGGSGGTFGGFGAASGNGASGGGGGGAGLGGAIFALGSSLYLSGCTFSGNSAAFGMGGAGGGAAASAYGGAIFAVTPQLTQASNTFSGNIASTGGPNLYLVAQPPLSVAQVNGGLHFSWPVDPANTWIQYQVEYRNVIPPPVWHNLNATITNDGTLYGCDAAVNTDPGGAIYRLIYSPH